MNPKAEKLALFRYGLIAPLVIEPLARGELTRRAEQIVDDLKERVAEWRRLRQFTVRTKAA